MKYFLIGIKGSGMAALAGVLQDDGHVVSGYDIDHTVFTENELNRRNIKIYYSEDIPLDVDFVIVGHSFMSEKLINKLSSLNIPYLEYHKFIEKYFSSLYQIAICGTHGKTTTTGYFYQAINKLLPASMIRGDGIGKGGFSNNIFVFEACEYQDHFLAYYPNVIVITNIDYDHVDYFKSKRQYNYSFNKFVKNTKKVIVNYDDRNKIHHKNIITYGNNNQADYHYENLDLSKGIKGDIYFHKEKIFSINLEIYGYYNSIHILALVAFLHDKGLDLRKAFENFDEFLCINRRMQHKIIARDVFIDDYAHHPNEIQASLDNVRLMYPSHRVVGVFKPDRYSRLVQFQKEFKKVLLNFDKAYVLPLYEKTNAKTKLLEINSRISYVDTVLQLCNEEQKTENTVYLFMSSKNIDDWIYGLGKYKE